MQMFYSHFYWLFAHTPKQILPAYIFRQLGLYNYRQVNDRLPWWRSFWTWWRLDLLNAISIELISAKELILLKVTTAQNAWFFIFSFLFHALKFLQDSMCNDCHDVTILCLNISNIAIITVKNVDCCCIIYNISNLEQFIYWKILHLKIVGIYKTYCQTFGVV